MKRALICLVTVVFCALSGVRTTAAQAMATAEGTPVRVDTLKPYVIEAVRVTPGGEDPAYRIMRMAIASAPYFRTQVEEYTARVYIKGSIEVRKFSGLVKRLARKEIKNIKEGTTYVDEALSEVRFSQPNHFTQKVIHRNGSLPQEMRGDEPMRLANMSIYDPQSVAVSPLSPGAFSHYRFTLENTFDEGGHTVHHIRVRPVRRSAELLEGWIEIVEGRWNVHAFDLSGRIEVVAGFEYRLRADFGEVEPGVWMPVEHNMSMNVSALGNKLRMRYVSHLDYTRVVESTDPAKPEPAQTVETNRDAYRMARVVRRKLGRISAERNERPQLDMTEHMSDNYKMMVDSVSIAPDSLPWETIRPVPLEPSELRGYRERGVMAARAEREDTTKTGGKVRQLNIGHGAVSVTVSGGKELKLGEKGGAIVWKGVAPSRVGFNTVDGFYFGFAPVEYVKEFSPGTDLRFSPDVGWAINRKALMWRMDARLRFAPMSRGQLALSMGSGTRNYSGARSIDNTFTALLFRRNYLKLYEDNFVEAAGAIDLANGLVLSGGMKYSRRRMLENSSNYSLFNPQKREYTPNIPVNEEVAVVPYDHSAAVATASIEFTPRYYYRVRDGRKEMVRSAWPTLFASWKKGLKGVGGSVTDFDHFSFGVKQNVAMGGMKRFDYFIQSGFFVGGEDLFFADFRHFGSTDFPLTGSSITSDNLFHLLPRYRYSTAGGYIDAHFYYRAPAILIKQIPWFGRRLWEESLQFNYLNTKALHNYMELGYTVGLVWQAGVFFGFDRMRYRNFSVRVSLPLKMFFGDGK